tara:strand:+ start:252 stop:1001 length:750 start_codon:yes stop_codon:yes gene_type:complete
MCISAKASANAFLVNLISAICLVYFGNENLKTLNYIIAIFSVFTSLMQIVDLGIWLDLDCKTGLNKAASLIGPILNYLQPVAIFFIAYIIMNYTKHGIETYKQKLAPLGKSSNFFKMFSVTSKELNLGKILNILAVLIIVILLVRYYLSGSDIMCTKLNGPHIKWGWLSKLRPDTTIFSVLYVITLLNFYFIDPKSIYIKIAVLGYIALFFISLFVNKSYTGELWCLISNILPLLLLVLQKLFKNQIQR